MNKAIINLIRALCRPDTGEEGLNALCTAACQKLDGMLAEGVTAEQCGESYVMAAAWMVMDWLNSGKGITALSAGDLSVRMDSTAGRLTTQAMELMRPWLKDKHFVFLGVKG